MIGVCRFTGGAFAALAIRAAVQSAKHIGTADDLLLVLVAALYGGLAALFLTVQKRR